MRPERLTALDASFLYLERPAMHMHVAGLSVFDPSTCPTGRWRFEDAKALIDSRLHLVPRFRQRVVTVPLNLGLPLWVDDPHFDLDFHVRRAALPSPGGRHELTEFAERIFSRPLDRSRPLWVLYLIEGLEGRHVASLLKVHHAMIDGISGMHLAAALWDLTPDPPPSDAAPAWKPEPEPSPQDLVRESIDDLIAHPVRAVSDAAETIRQSPALAALNVGSVLSGVRSVLHMGARPSSPFDVEIGPNRRFAMSDVPLRTLKEVKNALGGTVNDVVLCAVGSALHQLLRERHEPTRGRTLRAMVPVSVRGAHDRTIGNRVAPALVDIPVGPMKPATRLARVREGTRFLRESMMAMSADAIIGLGAYAPGGLLAAAARAISLGPWFNLVVSNIPGPQQPMYFAGARLVASYPSMPLNRNAALSIACSSLGGTMAFGLTGDRDAMPDIERLALALDDAIAELIKAAAV